MKVNEIMRRQVPRLVRHASLRQGFEVLHRTRQELLLLADENQGPYGVVSQDQLMRAIAEGYNPDDSLLPLADALVSVIAPEDTVETLQPADYWLVCANHHPVGLLAPADISLPPTPQALFATLQPLLETICVPFIVIDTACQVIAVNQSGCELLARPKEQMIGALLTHVLTPSEPKAFLQIEQIDFIKKFSIDGVRYLANWAPIRLRGLLIGACAMLRDISEYESLHDELSRVRDVSKELNAIIESSFDGMYVTDGASRTLRVNQAYERITGIANHEVVGKTMTQLVAAGVYDESVTLRVLKERRPVTIVQNIMKTGKTIVVTGNPIFNDDGRIFRVVTNVRDVTELHLLQEKLEKMEALHSEYERELRTLRKGKRSLRNFVIKSKKMKEIYELALKLALVDSTVLIQGDSGVGKEVFSEIIHQHGARRTKPFVKISCAAIPENLLESELFGYAPGAFTGASREGRAGIFELAHGGTIFLDEIGELPMALQVKLLRVLQEREIVRLGGTKPLKVDTRIMAATNRDLEEMVAKGQFRKDLFFRLNVVPVLIPPLRERKEAISHFISFFLKKHNQRYGFSRQIAPEAIDAMIDYDWPGNVRELENMVERLVVMARGEIITANDLPTKIRTGEGLLPSANLQVQPLKIALAELEKQLLVAAIEQHGSSRKVAAVLGINQSTVIRKANRLGIAVGKNGA